MNNIPSPAGVPDDIRAQIDRLDLVASRPLIISDADEVLFAFMKGFVAYLKRRGLTFDWSSFALTGNIREPSGEAVAADDVRSLLADFFSRHTAELEVVPGAAPALRTLAGRAQIVVLSNLPHAQRPARAKALKCAGMDYPIISNSGPKGAVVKSLVAQITAPAVFIDDIPRHHASVRQHAPSVWRLHFIADPRLAKLLGPAPDSHRRADTWPAALGAITDFLDRGKP